MYVVPQTQGAAAYDEGCSTECFIKQGDRPYDSNFYSSFISYLNNSKFKITKISLISVIDFCLLNAYLTTLSVADAIHNFVFRRGFPL
jgi:hypothetical protein